MTFKKGQSGNPGGKAKVLADGRTITDLARDHSEKAINALVKVLDDPGASHAAIVSAASALIDRGWGKARQEVGIEVTNDTATASLLERARKRAAEGGQERPH